MLGAVVMTGCFEPVAENRLGSAGGRLEFDGAVLVVPPGALESTVLFSAHPVQLPPQAPKPLGRAFVFEPDDVSFKKPVELRLKLDDPAARAQVLTSASVEGPWVRLPTQTMGGVAIAYVTHFSVYYPSEPPPPEEKDAGVEDAGVDSGVPVAECRLTCPEGFACVRDGGASSCVFGYQALRIVEPGDGGVVDAGTVAAVVELVPIPGLAPNPPPFIYSTVYFDVYTLLPIADGGPYMGSLRAAPQQSYALWAYATFFPPPGPVDAGTIFLEDRVTFTTQ
ncbi:MAG: hypothetical protein Q8L48_29600 [Archangium sp.]|nr:hypothetical protein [Archangium sp.]